jgi:hypothetical protein
MPVFLERRAEALVIPYLGQSFLDSVAFRDRFQKIERDLVFRFDPRPRLGRVGIFQRPVRIRDFYAVVIVDLVARRRGGILEMRLCSRVLNERQQPGSRERQKSEMHNSGNYVEHR